MSATLDDPVVPADAGRTAALVGAASVIGSPGGERAWRGLVGSARHPNPFLGPDLLLPALRHLAPPGVVRLLTGGGADRLDLLLPVATRQRVPRIPVRATVAWQHTHHFLGTPLVAPGAGPRDWRAALRELAADGGAWFLLPLCDLDVVEDVEAAARGLGLTTRRLAQEARPVTRRRERDDYAEQRLSGRRRKELRRVRRRLDEAVGGGLALVDLVEGAPPQAVEDALEQFLVLESAGWKGADGGAIAANPAERAFFLEACRGLAADGRLEVLALQGRRGAPVAMAVDLRAGDTLFTFKIAYDEQHAGCSPGLLLYLERLSRFHGSGAALVDTCAEPGHPMARRLHGDDRVLVSLAVSLGPRRGALAVRWAHALRRLAGSVRRRAPVPAPTRPREDHP